MTILCKYFFKTVGRSGIGMPHHVNESSRSLLLRGTRICFYTQLLSLNGSYTLNLVLGDFRAHSRIQKSFHSLKDSSFRWAKCLELSC